MSGVKQGLIGSVVPPSGGGNDLPEGTVLIFDRTSLGTAIPSGWSTFDAFEGNSIEKFLIRGGTTTSRDAVGVDGVISGNPAVSLSSPSTGGHPSGPSAPIRTPSMGRNGVTAGPQNRQIVTTVSPFPIEGNHTHALTKLSAGPWPIPNAALSDHVGQQVPLIRADSSTPDIPAGAIIFSGTGSIFSGFSRKTFTSTNINPSVGGPGGVFAVVPTPTGIVTTQVCGNTIPTPSDQLGPVAWLGDVFSWTSSGAHTHGAGGTTPARVAGPVATYTPQDGPSHTHTWTPTSPGPTNPYFLQFQYQMQSKMLLPCVAAADETVQSGMIVMYSGDTVPTGWYLCDGNNGTPDMVDWFLGYRDAATSGDTIVGRERVYFQPPSGPGGRNLDWSTLPYPAGDVSPNGQVQIKTPPVTWPHGHSSLPTIVPWPASTANGAHRTFSYPHSHNTFMIPWANFNLDTKWIPPNIVLMFIQKA